MDRGKYPPDWDHLSRRLREEAGNRCQWCGAANGRPHPRTGSTVVLTVAHLGLPTPADLAAGRCWGDKHDKLDTRPGNLAVLCQSCHLGYDRDDHLRHAAETRRARKLASGQRPLAEGGA